MTTVLYSEKTPSPGPSPAPSPSPAPTTARPPVTSQQPAAARQPAARTPPASVTPPSTTQQPTTGPPPTDETPIDDGVPDCVQSVTRGTVCQGGSCGGTGYYSDIFHSTGACIITDGTETRDRTCQMPACAPNQVAEPTPIEQFTDVGSYSLNNTTTIYNSIRASDCAKKCIETAGCAAFSMDWRNSVAVGADNPGDCRVISNGSVPDKRSRSDARHVYVKK